MEASSPEAWVHLFGDGALPAVLGWLAWSIAKAVNRWSGHMDKQEKQWEKESDHRLKVADHMTTEERLLTRVAVAAEMPHERPRPVPRRISGSALTP